MSELGCAQISEMAPEIALDSLSGNERAEALHHLSSCPDCRRLVDGFTEAGEQILSLAPSLEPPAGFESRVLQKLSSASGPPRRSRRWPLVAAALAGLLAAGAVSFAAGRRQQPPLENEYVKALRTLGGKSLAASAVVDPQGKRVGGAFFYNGNPSWVFVSLRGAGPGTYEVQARAGSATYSIGTLRLQGGEGSIGAALPQGAGQPGEVLLISSTGQAALSARLQS